jgi:hypothetical protein
MLPQLRHRIPTSSQSPPTPWHTIANLRRASWIPQRDPVSRLICRNHITAAHAPTIVSARATTPHPKIRPYLDASTRDSRA